MTKTNTAPNARRSPRAAKTPQKVRSSRAWPIAGAVAGAVLGGAALFNRSRAQRAERDNPPLGKFVTVGGLRLHYVERGDGPTIVLLHGNGTMIEDWIVSGVLDSLARTNRVVAFDRPGFGHSERPRSPVWTPSAQAALLADAFDELGLEKPVVIGHSFGTLVALALAIEHPGAVSRLGLVGGYYYPSARADVLFLSPPAIPGVGDVIRYTVSPLLGAASTPLVNKKIFSPAPVSERWLSGFPLDMMLRPSQLRAGAAEAAIMVPAAAGIAAGYGELKVPVIIVAGEGDAIVTTGDQSVRLHKDIEHSKLVVVPGAGHMVHHSATAQVVEALLAPAS
jgi:pimeloyl-ACP methyl ester carboxylesterase